MKASPRGSIAIAAALAVVAAVGCHRAAATERVTTSTAVDLGGDQDLAAPRNGACNVTIETPAPVSFQTDSDGVGFNTDYWASASEMRELLAYVAREEEELEESSVPAYVEAKMKQDPIFTLFQLNCLGDAAQVTFSPVPGSRYDDVPFHAGGYLIAETGREPNRGNVAVSMSGPVVSPDDFAVVGPGVFLITTLNRAGVEGTFAFKARLKKGAVPVQVRGSFSFRCVDHALCAESAEPKPAREH